MYCNHYYVVLLMYTWYTKKYYNNRNFPTADTPTSSWWKTFLIFLRGNVKGQSEKKCRKTNRFSLRFYVIYVYIYIASRTGTVFYTRAVLASRIPAPTRRYGFKTKSIIKKTLIFIHLNPAGLCKLL